MKTEKTTPPSSSANPPTVHLSIPTSWRALTEEQLHQFARIQAIEDITTDERRTLFLLSLLPGRYLERPLLRRIDPSELAAALPLLDFMDEPPEFPLRPLHLFKDGPKAVSPDLEGTPFSLYLQAENFYRGYLETSSSQALEALARLLYPAAPTSKKTKKTPPLTAAHHYLLLLWMVSLHAHYAQLFPHLFSRPAAQMDNLPSARDIMTAEIRTLTQGDVTRTPLVLQTETITALTELNERAREAEEVSKQMKKS